MLPSEVRAVADSARQFKDELLQRIRAGDIDVKREPIGLALSTDELWTLTVDLSALIGVADEYVALIESGPSRDELLDASTAAAQALAYAEEANERLGQIMGRLWLKPAPPAADVANDTRAEVG